MSTSARSLLLLVPLFFGSGVSSLIYQILWMRMLALVFGVTVHAATTVLASFMAGLAIGSALAGRLARRSASPLRWFGIIEVCIGASALLTHVALPEVARVFGGWQSSLPDAVAPQTIARFIAAFTVLLVPTTLMGMTLPLMLKASDTTDAHAGRRISVLYGTNTAGAVTGALLAGFVLIGAVGVTWSFRVAAILNMLVGAIALWLARDTPTARSTRTAPTRPRDAGDVPRVGVAVFALSGFAALALEVIWFRMLVYFVPATSYAFSTMLAAVLLGLTLGSYCATPLLRRTDRLATRLAWIHYATALCIPLAATAIASAYRAGWHTTADIHISVVLALPPAALMGMAYPLGLGLWGLERSGEGIDATRVGDLNSANLLGGIAGAIAGGFVILPWVGTRTGLVVLAMAYLINSLILVRGLFPPGRGAMVGAIGSLVAVAAAATVPDLLVVAGTRRYPRGEQLIWQQEGAQTTAAVMRRPEGGRVLYLDGLHQASDAPDIVWLHRMIGHLPMALHPDPRRSIVVGLGGGVTPGAVSQHDTQLDVVELSSSVVESARWFEHVNNAVTSQPNVRLRIDDGRNFLLGRAGRYDVITADLIQPEHAGAGHLYSREYFTLMRRALAEDGLVLQWIGHRPQIEYKLILRTFLDVFPHTTLWAGGQLLVGTRAPLAVSREAFERKIGRAGVRAALESVGLGTFDALVAQYVAGSEELRVFAGSGPLLTDDRPLLEYFRSLPRTDRASVDLSGVKGSVQSVLR